MVKIRRTCFEAFHQESKSSLGINLDFPAIQPQKDIGRKEGNPLVAICKRMIDQQGFKEGRGHFLQGTVIPGLRPEQSTFQHAFISNTRRTAKSLNQAFMNNEQLVQGEEFNCISWQGVFQVPRFRS